jgi:hypothetical protein
LTLVNGVLAGAHCTVTTALSCGGVPHETGM